MTCNATISGTVHFQNNNIADRGAGMVVACDTNEHCTITIDGNVSFLNNTAVIGGGALFLDNSNLKLLGKISFENNSAAYGGALKLNRSNIYLWPTASVSLSNNYAKYDGGAMHFQRSFLYLWPNALVNVSTIMPNAMEEQSMLLILIHIHTAFKTVQKTVSFKWQVEILHNSLMFK